ncbi:EAL domain-containing protein [Sphingobium ummariense]|uniref:EAL domain-containing protein n=1 Tax=Sphingobium ummariense RL-3 TaxID=1346791 RepID=T0IYL9_9SPHN|nr:EAL domain-containing protein [Sphingobium ummariense]EQB29627.1 hypothetical protein M529_23915 [Sphingobium ummariense RL-3]
MVSAAADGSEKGIDRLRIGDLVLAFRIDNYSLLRAVYSLDTANAAVDAVIVALARLFTGVRIQRTEPGMLYAAIPASTRRREHALPAMIDSVCTLIMCRPLECDGERVYFSLSTGYAVASDAHLSAAGTEECLRIARDMLCACRSAAERPTANDSAWADHYRADMRTAATLLRQVDRGEAHFVWQPVCNATEKEAILYYEALLRTVSADGQQQPCGEAIGALERLGLVRILDQRTVSLVIDELEADPLVCLGVNISGQSASFHLNGHDAFWSELRERLSRDRSLARRLVVEITETAAHSSLRETVDFVTQLRALGCRIAIDDFGAGYASPRQLLALRPDIVKVDAFFLGAATQHAETASAFPHMVGLARSLAPTVIAEGVETAQQEEAARASGVQWLQGHQAGRPSVTRAWLDWDYRDSIRALVTFKSYSEAPAHNAQRAA